MRRGGGAATAGLGLALALAALAGEPPDAAAPGGELADALREPADPEAGRRSFQVCASCHGADAAGRPDGTFPVLAGQHRRVLAKQMVDMRQGTRDNPIMHPFARTLAGPREIADLSAWLAALPPPGNPGTGPGDALPRGRALYERDCARCHGPRGGGDAAAFVPALAGQHYRYLLRQLRDIAAGRRHNAHPEMQRVVRAYRDAELRAVADYASRLRPEGPLPDTADDEAGSAGAETRS